MLLPRYVYNCLAHDDRICEGFWGHGNETMLKLELNGCAAAPARPLWTRVAQLRVYPYRHDKIKTKGLFGRIFIKKGSS